MNKRLLFSSLFLLNAGQIFAVNEISIRQDQSHQTKPGYITSASLSIEPQGGYVSEALYIEYSDNGQFIGSNVEIIHRFNLPRGAVVRDLWLWIGDSVMQAQIKDTWTARHVYDSITSFKRDPAFLNVIDGQYELRIYPLESGKIRKIKMEYLVPVLFIGEQAQVDLPYSFLNSDNSSKTPLRVLFRYDNRFDYHFTIAELDSLEYQQLPDTLEKHYYESNIADIKLLSSLTVRYSETFPNGYSCSREAVKDGSVYSIGISPTGIFNPTSTERIAKRLCVGIDLNGKYPSLCIKTLLEGLDVFKNGILGDEDSVKVIITGYGLVDTFPKSGLTGNNDFKESLETFINGSKIISAVKNSSKPRILFCDDWAHNDWAFPGLEALAECSTATNLMSAISVISHFNIVAAIKHGNGENLNDDDASLARTRIVEFIKNGGYFLTYYDHNRGKEKIASYLIEGLKLPSGFKASNLTRTSNGNISFGFPNSFYYYSSCPLVNSDEQAIPELMNSDNEPVVISKKFGSGYFVVSGMWPPHDDAGLKQQVHPALLGLQISGSGSQTTDLIKALYDFNDDFNFNKIVVMSNADVTVTAENLSDKLTELDTVKLSRLPQTYCISLLDGTTYTPPIYTSSGVNYYGSGYLLCKIAERKHGLYFGMHEYDWRTVLGIIFNNNPMMVKNFSFAPKCNGVAIAPETVMQPNPLNEKLNSSRFYTVQCKTCEVIEAEVTGISPENDSALQKSLTIETRDVLNRTGSFISTEHANDIMLKMFQTIPLDTQEIVNFALEHRLMNDFTAFIALEPNDSIFFMQNPNDESNYHRTSVSPDLIKSIIVKFAVRILKILNNISFVLDIPQNGNVQIRIFNIAGRLLYRQDLSNCRIGATTILLKNKPLGKGMYLVAVKYFPHGMNYTSIQTRIGRFTLE